MSRGVTLLAYLAAVGAGTAASVQLWIHAFAAQESVLAPEVGLPRAQTRGVPAVVVRTPRPAARLAVVRAAQGPTSALVLTPFLPGVPTEHPSSPVQPQAGPSAPPVTPQPGPPQPGPAPAPGQSAPSAQAPEPAVVAPARGTTPTAAPPRTVESAKPRVRVKKHGKAKGHSKGHAAPAAPASPSRPPDVRPATPATPAAPPSTPDREKHGKSKHEKQPKPPRPSKPKESSAPATATAPPAQPAPEPDKEHGQDKDHGNGHGK